MWEGIGEDGEDEPCDGLTGLGEGIGEDGATAAASRRPRARPPCSGRHRARRHRLLALSPRRGPPPPRRARPSAPPHAGERLAPASVSPTPLPVVGIR
jgi:hypothetical protein